ncbi:hypothetical protein COT72_03740 [archaeon CG10_big_fil_rev_8_21_14_0_10_43_11]|nr:MAG: hypothetical protein COT72_03740 [archaeon CG10_big_fil_rev_8_21_14_0_10_43_11]
MLKQDYLEKLVSTDNISIIPFDKHTKNDKYILYQENKPILFIKVYSESPLLREMIEKREKGALSFFNETELIPVPTLINSQQGFLITTYQGELQDVLVEECINDIASFHTAAVGFNNYPNYLKSKIFSNDRRVRGVPRLDKHAELLKDTVDTERLHSYINEVPPHAYEELPKILTHGDLHRGNIHRKESGDILFNDFERAYFDYPTWDLARALFDVSITNVKTVLDSYISQMENTALMQHATADELEKLIFGDCVYRIITDIISDRQSLDNPEILKIHTKRNLEFLERYIF